MSQKTSTDQIKHRRLAILPENFAKSWEYHFQIFFGRDRIEFADKQNVVLGFNVGTRQITDLTQRQMVQRP